MICVLISCIDNCRVCVVDLRNISWVHHHYFHSACRAWCLMTKQLPACPLFLTENHIFLHQLSRFSLPRYVTHLQPFCGRSIIMFDPSITGRVNKLLLVSKNSLLIQCSLLTHTSMPARIWTCKDSML